MRLLENLDWSKNFQWKYIFPGCMQCSPMFLCPCLCLKIFWELLFYRSCTSVNFTGSTHSFGFMELWSFPRKGLHFHRYKQNICLWSNGEIDRATVNMEMLNLNLIWKQPNQQCDITYSVLQHVGHNMNDMNVPLEAWKPTW